MAGILRRLRRSNKKAAKFRFSVTLQELQLTTDNTWKPDTLVVSFLHRRRKVSSKERKWEQSFSDQAKCVLIWPEQMAEEINIVTTLYRSNDDDQYDDKEWTIVVEEVTAKGKRKPIAAVPLNVRLFILDLPDHKSELKLKLRPLVPMLKQSSLVLLLGSVLTKEVNADEMSVTSSVNTSILERNNEKLVDEVDAATPQRRETRNQIEKVTTEIHEWSSSDDKKQPKKTIEKTEIVFEEREVAPPPIPAHRKSEEGNEQAGKVRPLWRVSAEEEKVITNRQSRTSRGSTEERTSTTAVFEVDSNSRAVPVQVQPIPISTTNNSILTNKTVISTTTHLDSGSLPRPRSHSPRAPSRDAAPQPVVGESLLSWCQRVTNGYSNVRIVDFTKSWRNGLALCAIFHTYRPELIGEYGALDFSDRIDGRKANIKKALTAANLIGLSDIPDESDLLTPDKKLIELLLQRLRRIFEGNFEDATPTSASDHRISQIFGISEAEQKVVDMINKIREKEDMENAVDYTNVEDSSPPAVKTDEVLKTPQTVNREDGDEDAETSNLNFGRNNVSITMVTPGFTNIRASGRQASPSKRDELRRRARDMLEKTSTLPSSTPTYGNDEENEKRREQARKILEEAAVDGGTFKLSSNRQQNSSTPQFNRNSKLNGSSTDLRRVELVRPSVDVHRFKKRDPSPTLVRKQYDPNDTPILPAIGRSVNNGSRTRMDELSSPSTFDRVKRYGSMRSAELKESLQVLAKQYGYGNVSGSQEYLATPTKKFSSQWEKDVDDVEGTALEQEKIEQRISDVEEQSKAIKDKIADTEKSSSEEQMLLETFIRLTNEKNMLVGRQEYYNIIENIRQTTQQIDDYAHKLDELTKNADDYPRSSDEKRATDDLMDNYRKALDAKSNLVQKLFAQEEEIQEDEERLNNLTLERASRFVRGIDQPVSASKRLMQWWRR